MEQTNKEVRKAVEMMDLTTERKIKRLNVKERALFNDSFRKHLRSKPMSIFLAFLSLHYLYIDITRPMNWFKQILYIGTTGGFLLWLVYDIFTMNKILGKMYDMKAEEILNKMKG